MENFKISVDVNVKFSEETIKAIASIFSSTASAATTKAPATQAPATQAPATQAPATAKPETKPAPAATAAPAAPAATAAPAKPASISIDEVRAVLVNKVNAHREEIKNKLTELGAPSVTKLDPSKYEEMLNFLNSLD